MSAANDVTAVISHPVADRSYNGWANYETWVTHLWLTNDQGTDEEVRELVAQAFEDEDEYPRVTAADYLRWWVEDAFALPTDGLAADLIGHAVGQVEWLDIVDALREES